MSVVGVLQSVEVLIVPALKAMLSKAVSPQDRGICRSSPANHQATPLQLGRRVPECPHKILIEPLTVCIIFPFLCRLPVHVHLGGPGCEHCGGLLSLHPNLHPLPAVWLALPAPQWSHLPPHGSPLRTHLATAMVRVDGSLDNAGDSL